MSHSNFRIPLPYPAKIYANEGVAQMLFYQSDEQCEVTYKQRGGKYMGSDRGYSSKSVTAALL